MLSQLFLRCGSNPALLPGCLSCRKKFDLPSGAVVGVLGTCGYKGRRARGAPTSAARQPPALRPLRAPRCACPPVSRPALKTHAQLRNPHRPRPADLQLKPNLAVQLEFGAHNGSARWTGDAFDVRQTFKVARGLGIEVRAAPKANRHSQHRLGDAGQGPGL